jgi:hypothetical protein
VADLFNGHVLLLLHAPWGSDLVRTEPWALPCDLEHGLLEATMVFESLA